MHESDSYEVSSHGHYRPQERQRKTRDRADRRKNWLKLNSFSLYQSQDDKPGTHNSQRQAARIIGVSLEIGTASAKKARPSSVQKNANISSECLIIDKAVQLQPDFLSLLVWKFFCNPSASPSFFSETRNNNRQMSFAKTIFSLLFKCVIYIIRFLTRITSSRGIQ